MVRDEILRLGKVLGGGFVIVCVRRGFHGVDSVRLA